MFPPTLLPALNSELLFISQEPAYPQLLVKPHLALASRLPSCRQLEKSSQVTGSYVRRLQPRSSMLVWGKEYY